MLWPNSIRLGGLPLPLGDVIADVAIHHGRADISSGSTATTCQLRLQGVAHDFVRNFQVGQLLEVDAQNGAGAPARRFTGYVSDATLDVDVLTIIAAGRLATLRGYPIGLADWPAETWSARITRMFLEAGLRLPTMIGNPGFETDTSGWATSGVTHLVPGAVLTRTTAEPHSGVAAAEVRTPDAYSTGIQYEFDAVIGKTYTASVWVKAPLPQNYFGVYLAERVTGANYVYAQTYNSGDWQQLTTPPWTAQTTRGVLFVRQDYPYANVLYVDDVELADARGLLDLRPDPLFDPLLAARTAATAGPTTLGDYLDFVAPMVGALVADHLDGRILVQALGSRTLDGAIVLDPSLVAYAPAWVMALPAGNVVTVRYQADQGASVTVRDDASVALYGRELKATIDTTYVNLADADERAQTAVDRGAYAHWNILEAPVLQGLELELGTPVVLEEMPASSPADPWTPIVEGWAETITGEEWTMQLALSDPRLSGIAPLPWTDAVGYAWNTVNPATAWYEAQTLADLSTTRSS